MIISHKHQYIFFKPLKVAGSSIEVALSKCLGNNDVHTGTSYLREINSDVYSYKVKNNFEIVEETTEQITAQPIFLSHTSPDDLIKQHSDWNQIKDYYKITSVRNPWDLCVSYFWWTFNDYVTLGQERKYKIRENIAPMSYDTSTVLKIKFQSYLESRLDHTTVELGVKKDEDTLLSWFARLQQSFFMSEHIDYVIRFEKLQEDLQACCEKLRLEMYPLQRLKSDVRKSSLPYQAYFNDYTKDLVADYFSNVITQYNYKF